MDADRKALIEQIVAGIGGKENLKFANHCATRLRLQVNDASKVKEEAVKSTRGVLGVVQKDNEVQIIIGTHVNSVYNDFIATTGEQATASADPSETGRKAKFSVHTIIDFLSGVFVPVLPVLVAAGLVAAVLNISTMYFGLDRNSGTVVVLSAINSAGFFFLPVYLGVTTARKLGINGTMGAFLGGILLSDTINNAEGLSFLGIPIAQTTYASTTLPVIFGVLLMAFVEKNVDKVIPKELKFFLRPLVTVLITVPVVLVAFGPASVYLSNIVAQGLDWVNTNFGWLSLGVFGLFSPFIVMLGLDKAFLSVITTSLATNGYESFMLPGMLVSNVAVGSAALAAFFLSKNSEFKGLSLSAGITGILGITEPSLFGVCLKYMTPLYGAMIGGGAGGVFAGIFQLKQYALVSPGLASIVTYVGGDGQLFNFWIALISALIAIVVSFAATMILSKVGKTKRTYG
ncbi:PTS transporter subunit EIIC [Paenibacillus terreus]|uniref:PTS transporter subunit EIIC n=1 Tax=Paenibacillus terreus TaxID=1387834 RepID=A0ABV5B2S0_9BACL